MKISSLFLFLFIIIARSNAQTVDVRTNKPITTLNEGTFYFPKSNPDGSKIFFTSSNYKGLWFYNLESKKLQKVNNYPGAGFKFRFSENGNKIMFRKIKFVNKRKYSSLVSFDFIEREESVLIPPTRELKVIDFSDAGLFLKIGNKIKLLDNNIKLKNNPIYDIPKVDIENRNIVIYKNGTRTVLQPLGKGIYLWPSISPDGTKLLFTLGGKGTYISDLSGNILMEIGYANYPSWSSDGKWILCMKDKDDGYNFTYSDLFLIKSDGTKEIQLTSSKNVIELYPSWLPGNKGIIYNTNSGIVYLMELKISN